MEQFAIALSFDDHFWVNFVWCQTPIALQSSARHTAFKKSTLLWLGKVSSQAENEFKNAFFMEMLKSVQKVHYQFENSKFFNKINSCMHQTN